MISQSYSSIYVVKQSKSTFLENFVFNTQISTYSHIIFLKILKPKKTPHQTIPVQKWPLIRPFPSGSDLWSHHSHPEVTSDHTISRPKVTPGQTISSRKWHLIIPFPYGSDLWSDHSHPEPKPRPSNFGLGTHPVPWTWLIRGHFRMAPQPGITHKHKHTTQDLVKT